MDLAAVGDGIQALTDQRMYTVSIGWNKSDASLIVRKLANDGGE